MYFYNKINKIFFLILTVFSPLLPVHVPLELGEGGESLVPPHSPLPELLHGHGLDHGRVQGGGLRLVSIRLLPEHLMNKVLYIFIHLHCFNVFIKTFNLLLSKQKEFSYKCGTAREEFYLEEPNC